MHPGGKTILAQMGGQDCTEAFKTSHTHWREIRDSQDMRQLLVGRVAPGRPASQPLVPAEFEYRNYIYAPPGLCVLEPSLCGQVIEDDYGKRGDGGGGAEDDPYPWGGSDGVNRDETGHDGVEDADGGGRDETDEEKQRREVWEENRERLIRPGYCVAKRVPEKGALPTMTEAELRLCDGQEGDGWFNEAWAAVDDKVYNLSSESSSFFLLPNRSLRLCCYGP